MSNKMLRIEKLRKFMKNQSIDCIIIAKRENYFYFSGFDGSFANLLITQNELYLLTDFRYIEQASLQADLFTIIEVKDTMKNMIKEALEKKDITTIGFEDNCITYNKYAELEITLKNFQLIPLNENVDSIRLCKDEQEIEIINKAVGITDLAFEHILKYIKPGVIEIDIANEIEYFMKKNGAKKMSFDTIVASGIRSSLPHGIASRKKIEYKDIITLDFGCVYDEYCSDMTRTIFVGEIDAEWKKVYNIVLRAQKEAINLIKPNMYTYEVDSIARNIINKEGYEKNFGHALGHGVGLNVHEEPRLSPSSKQILLNNMVVTVEPGIYINNSGGVRIEDIVVVKDGRCNNLTKSSKEIICL